MEQFDLMVIGGGSAGMKAARTAARMGKTVALAEERELGGECFWAGCVPTKALVRAAEVWNLVRNSERFGIHVSGIQTSFRDAMKYKEQAVQAVGGGDSEPDEARLQRIGIKYFPTRATFCDPNVIQVGRETIRAKNIIIATGTIPYVPYVEGLEETGYITNREAVALTELPKRLIVIGAGPIGLEFAQVYRRFGSEVTVLEAGLQILANEDPEIASIAAGILEEEGIRVVTGAKAVNARKEGSEKVLTIEANGHQEVLRGDEILVAAGRAAATGDLDLDSAKVEYTQRSIKIDQYMRTSQPHILVAGDASGGYMFTHVASYEGKLAAENIFGDTPVPYDTRVVPRATFIDPEVASIGLTESAAVATGVQVGIRRFLFSHLDRAILHGDPKGMVKLVVNAKTEEIVGGHIIGPSASSLIAEIALAMKHNLTVSDIAETMHAYPSFPEAIEAAALSTPTFVGQVESN